MLDTGSPGVRQQPMANLIKLSIALAVVPHARLKAEAEQLGIKPSELIRRIVDEWLSKKHTAVRKQ